MKILKLLVLCALMNTLFGCGGGGSGSRPTPVTATPPTTGTAVDPVEANAEEEISADLLRRTYDAAALNREGSMAVDVAENDVSFLLNLSVDSSDQGILISKIVDPTGATIYTSDEEGNIGGALTQQFLADNGAVNMMIPVSPAQTLMTGQYLISFETEDDVPIVSASVLVKSVASGKDVDLLTHRIDLNVLTVHSDIDLFGAVKLQALIDTQYRNVIDRILLLHDLQLGVVQVSQGSSQAISDYADLVAETEEHNACQAALDSSDTALALNLVFVESISSAEDPDAGIAGFSPQYGTVGGDEANNGCFFVSQSAYDLSSGLTQEESDGLQGGNVLHEAGHFIGLPHTSEGDGEEFDEFSDTPECTVDDFDGLTNNELPISPIPGTVDGVVDDFECGFAGGADNFIFYSGIAEYLPFKMSAEQAWVIRRHPLARPTQ